MKSNKKHPEELHYSIMQQLMIKRALRSEEDIKAGRVYSLEEAKNKLKEKR